MRKIILIIAAVLLVICIIGVVIIAVQTGKTQEQFGPLMDACRGQGVSGAAAYEKTPGNHPAMGVMKSAKGDLRVYPYAIPDEVKAQSVADTQVVLCLTEAEEVLLERCPYAKGDKSEATNVAERYFYQQEAKLVEAKTGQVIAEEVFKGKEPRACADQETFLKGQETLKIAGKEISDNDLKEWVRPYIIVK